MIEKKRGDSVSMQPALSSSVLLERKRWQLLFSRKGLCENVGLVLRERRHDLKDVEGGLAAKVVDNPSVDLQAINLFFCIISSVNILKIKALPLHWTTGRASILRTPASCSMHRTTGRFVLLSP